MLAKSHLGLERGTDQKTTAPQHPLPLAPLNPIIYEAGRTAANLSDNLTGAGSEPL